MDSSSPERRPVLTHEEYINSLLRPSFTEERRISEIQLRKEREIDERYRQPINEHDAASRIQKTYRGYRERRQLKGLALDPSSRWIEVIRELRYRSAMLPPEQWERPKLSPDGKPRSSSDVAKDHWRRIGYVVEHASAGEHRNLSEASGEREPSMLMDVRYFLEMVDQRHRYGSNLQIYHEEWLRSKSDRNFFHWLDEGDGQHLDLPGCTREKLDWERIRYLSKDERRDYLVQIDADGRLRWAKTTELITTSINDFKDSMTGIVPRSDDSAPSFADEEVRQQVSVDRHLLDGLAHDHRHPHRVVSSDTDETASDEQTEHADPAGEQHSEKKDKKHHKRVIASPATILNKLLQATVRPGTFIYVADTVGRLYVGIKDSGAFQHASFLSGARISSAGLIGIDDGFLTYLSPLSGHYRPTTKSLRRFIGSLKSQGADLSHLRVSHAYEVLLGIEYYGKTKKGLKKLHPPRKQHKVASPGPDLKLHDAINNMSATDLVEENWKRKKRRSTLTKMLDDLRLRSRNSKE